MVRWLEANPEPTKRPPEETSSCGTPRPSANMLLSVARPCCDRLQEVAVLVGELERKVVFRVRQSARNWNIPLAAATIATISGVSGQYSPMPSIATFRRQMSSRL